VDQAQKQAPGAGCGGIVPPPEHRWKPGQSGNPKGRPKGASVVEPLLRKLSLDPNEYGEGLSARELAAKLYEKALEGDMKALSIVLDRVDGPVQQHLEHSGGLTQVILRGGEAQAAGEGERGTGEAVEGF
jgi:hypothetical protein